MKTQIVNNCSKRHLSHDLAKVGVWVLIAIFVVYFSALALTKHQAFLTHGFDLGNYDQTVWNTSRGHLLVCTNWPPFGESRLAYHVEPILLLIAPFYWLHAGPETLLVLQAVVVGLGAWPVAQIAQRRLGLAWMGPLFALVYLLFPALQTGLVFEFHAVTLAATFLAMAFYAIEHEQYGAFAGWAILAAACKEEISLLVAMMGFYLIVRKRRYALGGVCVGLSVAWFLICIQLILPHFNVGGESAHIDRYGYLGDGLVDILMNIVCHPRIVLDVLRDPIRLGYLWRMPMPVGYLALLAPEILLLALPTIAINVLSVYAPMYAFDFLHYSVPVVPFIVIAAVFGFERLMWLVDRFLARYRRWFFVAVVAGYVLVVSLFYQSVFGYTPLARSFNWPQITAHHDVGHAILDDIPAQAAVSAQMPLNPHVSQRRWVYVFPAIEDADFVVLDVSSPRDIAFELDPDRIADGDEMLATGGAYSGDPSLTHTAYQQRVNDLLQGDDFGVVEAADGFLVLGRDVPETRLPEVFYSVFLYEGDIPGPALDVAFGDVVTLAGLVLEPGPGSAYYLHTYWRGTPSYSDDTHIYLVLVDQSHQPGQVVLDQELTISAFGSDILWEREGIVHDRVFVFFPSDPEMYRLGLMVTTGPAAGRMGERSQITAGGVSDVVQVADEIAVLLLDPAGVADD